MSCIFRRVTREIDIRQLMADHAKPTGEYESVDVDLSDLIEESKPHPTEPETDRS